METLYPRVATEEDSKTVAVPVSKIEATAEDSKSLLNKHDTSGFKESTDGRARDISFPLSVTTKKPHRVTIAVCLRPEDAERIKTAAAAQHCSVSKLIEYHTLHSLDRKPTTRFIFLTGKVTKR